MKKFEQLVLLIPVAFLLACSSEAASSESDTLIDEDTPDEIASVQASEGDFVIEHLVDSMDRGNHDYSGELVVKEGTDVTRGKVVYFNTPESVMDENPDFSEQSIARIVGLPGEEVEIQDGHVYIDGKKLESFYSFASVRGADEEEYFESVPAESDIDFFEEYFSMNIEATTVGEDEVYLLVDHWWRGADSKDFGTLHQDEIIGEVLGYSK